MSDGNPSKMLSARLSTLRLSTKILASSLIGFVVGVTSRGAFWVLENAEIGSEWFPSQWFFVAGLVFGALRLNGLGLFVGIVVGYVIVFIPFFINDSLFLAIIIISICVTSTAPLGWLISYLLIHGVGTQKKSEQSATSTQNKR